MPDLSERARVILDLMEPNRGYQASELRLYAPDLSMEALREVMHELWIARHVDRFGDCGWRRVPSRSAPRRILDGGGRATAGADEPASLRIGAVTPEDLFDHESFAGWFK